MKQLTESQVVQLYRTFFVVGDMASLKIIYELDRFGEKTFSELRDELAINPATLSKKLKVLTEVGIVGSDRTHDHLRVFYSIVHHQKTVRRMLDYIEQLSRNL